MRKRSLGFIVMAVLASLTMILAAPPAQADTWPDAYTQIINHQIAGQVLPIKPGGAPTYMSNGLGLYYTGPNGLEMRLTNAGTIAVTKFALTTASVTLGTAITGGVSTAGDAAFAGISIAGVRNTLILANILTNNKGPEEVQNAVTGLITQNKCLGITVPLQSIGDWLNRATYLMGAGIVGAFLGDGVKGVSIWLEPCKAQPLGDVWVPTSFPGIAGVLAAQPVAAPVAYNASVGGMISLGTDQLTTGSKMYPNQYLISRDDRYVLALQGDGNLVLYGNSYRPIWSSGTAGRSVDHLLVQGDGNVVMYGTGSQGPIWATGTVGSGGSSFKVQEDGNVVLYTSNGVSKWSLGINQGTTGGTYLGTDTLNSNQWLRPGQYIKSGDGRYVLFMQGDGNLVMWSPGKRQMWCSCTTRAGAEGAVMQSDGNFVLYGSGAYWATNTGGAGPFQFKLQNDGNLVLYSVPAGPRWSTGTTGKI